MYYEKPFVTSGIASHMICFFWMPFIPKMSAVLDPNPTYIYFAFSPYFAVSLTCKMIFILYTISEVYTRFDIVFVLNDIG